MNYIIQTVSVFGQRNIPANNIQDAITALRVTANEHEQFGWFVQRALDGLSCEMESPETHVRYAVQIVEVNS